jgi:copper homeostasis protein
MVKIEICTGSYRESIEAADAGASRIELCSALSIGGLTPSIGITKQIIKDIKKTCEVHVMIRPTEGGFCYSEQEFNAMKETIKAMAQCGVNGIVFGILDNNMNFNLHRTNELVILAKKHNLITTIHRAIDVCQNPNEALEKLINIGVDRILTSGQQKKAIDGISIIQSMIERCNGKIEIMPGSGINETNALLFVNIGAKSVHFTARKSIENNNDFGFGADYEFDLLKFNTINNLLN